MNDNYVAVHRTYVGTEIASHQNGHVKSIPRKAKDKFRTTYWTIAATILFVAIAAVIFVLDPECFEKNNSTLSNHSLMDSGYVDQL